MANVLFKRGTQSGLPTQGNAVDGALYFTTDTRRLFLGLSDHSLIPIAEGITAVGSAISLPTASEHTGEFYYIAPQDDAGGSAGNILAYSDGTKWLQVNMSTYITTMSQTATMSGSDAVVSLTTSQRNGSAVVQGPSASFKFVAGDNVTLSTSGNEVTINVADDVDTQYTLSTSAGASSTDYSGGVATVGIELTPNSVNAATSTVTIKESTSVAVVTGTDGISFAIKPAGVDGVNTFSAGTGNPAGTSSDGFYHKVGTRNGARTLSTHIDPQIKIGSTASTQETLHFVDGVATLSVYTIQEIGRQLDELKRTMDAMEYRGTVDTWAQLDGEASKGNGNAWKATAAFEIPGAYSTTASTVSVQPGYLIIATGSEGSDGVLTTVSYDVIAGDSTDTRYQFESTTNGIRLKNSIGGYSGTFTFSSDTLTLSTTSADAGVNSILAIDLPPVSPTPTTSTVSQTAGQTTTINVITGVSTDTYGRVDGIETTSLTLIDSNVTAVAFNQTVTSTNNVATITQQVGVGMAQSSIKSLAIGSAGNTIQVTTTSTGTAGNPAYSINVDLIWEEF